MTDMTFEKVRDLSGLGKGRQEEHLNHSINCFPIFKTGCSNINQNDKVNFILANLHEQIFKY
jgi:hypothetical protein